MPIERPTRQELLALARTEIEARLPGADAHLRRSILDVFARIHSAQTHALYGYLDYHIKQPFAQLADSEWLRRIAELYGVAEVAPTYALGDLEVTGTDGVIIENGFTFRRADGREYVCTTTQTIASGTATVPVTATAIGEDGNTAAGTSMQFTSPVAGANQAVTVAAGGLVGGTDSESDESLRARVLLRIRHPAGAGTTFDYQAQVKTYAGVTDVFVHSAQYGPGTVGVAPLFYDRDDPIPTAGDITAIQALLDDPAFKPLCATPTAYALTPEPQDFTIELEPDTTTVRAAVVEELEALFRREAEPGGVILISHIREAISIAAGETDHTLTDPIADVDLAGDLTKISTVGTFTWV